MKMKPFLSRLLPLAIFLYFALSLGSCVYKGITDSNSMAENIQGIKIFVGLAVVAFLILWQRDHSRNKSKKWQKRVTKEADKVLEILRYVKKEDLELSPDVICAEMQYRLATRDPWWICFTFGSIGFGLLIAYGVGLSNDVIKIATLLDGVKMLLAVVFSMFWILMAFLMAPRRRKQRYMSLDEVQTFLQENISVGESAREVATLVNGMGIDNVCYPDDRDDGWAYPEEKDCLIKAWVYNKEDKKSPEPTSAILIKFYFDNDTHFKRFEIKECFKEPNQC